jgi:hypothetical protein
MTADLLSQLAAARETFCYASPGSEAEFTSLLLGFDTAVAIVKAALPAQPNSAGELDALVAALAHAEAALDWTDTTMAGDAVYRFNGDYFTVDSLRETITALRAKGVR